MSLKEVLDLTWYYRANWEFIGIELGINRGTIAAIKENSATAEKRLAEMMDGWLKHDQPKPSRQALNSALQSERVQLTAQAAAGIYARLLYDA